jgi:hypothetical protein
MTYLARLYDASSSDDEVDEKKAIFFTFFCRNLRKHTLENYGL